MGGGRRGGCHPSRIEKGDFVLWQRRREGKRGHSSLGRGEISMGITEGGRGKGEREGRMSFDSFRGFWRGSLIQREIFLFSSMYYSYRAGSQGRFNLSLRLLIRQ